MSAAGCGCCAARDRDDYAFEFPPEFGRMLMFRVCDHSWHGFLPQKGARMSLQLCYVDSEWYVRKEYWRHSFSALVKSNPDQPQNPGMVAAQVRRNDAAAALSA